MIKLGNDVIGHDLCYTPHPELPSYTTTLRSGNNTLGALQVIYQLRQPARRSIRHGRHNGDGRLIAVGTD